MSETVDETLNPVVQLIPNYMYASAIAALAYDIMIHCDDEIKYIWQSAWSVPKALYFAARYYPIIYLSAITSDIIRSNTSTKLCQEYWWYYGFGGMILIVPTVNIVLSLRVSALYGHKRELIVILSVIFSMEFVGEFITTAYITIPDAEKAAGTSLPFYGCDTAVSANPILTRFDNLAWSVTMFASFTLFMLTLFKLWCYRAEFASRTPSDMPEFMPSPLFTLLFKDGAFYFFIIFASGCLAMVSLLGLNTFLAQKIFSPSSVCDFASTTTSGLVDASFRPFVIAIYSLSGSRLVLNLRRITVEDVDAPTDLTAPIRFNTFGARSRTTPEEVHLEEA